MARFGAESGLTEMGRGPGDGRHVMQVTDIPAGEAYRDRVFSTRSAETSCNTTCQVSFARSRCPRCWPAASRLQRRTIAPPAPVGATLDVAVRELPRIIAAEGQVEAVRQTTLGAQVAGRIVALDVKAGDSVRAGQVLARIDARTADQAVAAGRSQVAEAEANLANAKRKYERNRDLVAQKFVSQAALDQADAEYKAAQAQLAAIAANAGQAVAAQSFTTIAAPYAGVIGATLAELGDMAQPGRPLITIFDPRELRVVATVPQAALATIRLDAADPHRDSSARQCAIRGEGDGHSAGGCTHAHGADTARSPGRRASPARAVRTRAIRHRARRAPLPCRRPRCCDAAR